MNNIEETRTLNPYQKEAVLDENPACLVNANVGSGKTTVLIEKVRYLHEKKQIPYEKMAVLTFTNSGFLKASSVNSGSCLPRIDMLCPPYLSSIFNEYIYIGVLNTISISIFVYIITNIIQYCKRYF